MAAGAHAPRRHRRRGSRRRFPSDVLPPLPPFEVPAPAESEQTLRRGPVGGARMRARANRCRATRSSTCPSTRWSATEAPADSAAAAGDQDFTTGWAAVRDANIRPYAEWRPGAPVALPVLTARPPGGRRQQRRPSRTWPRPRHGGGHGGGGGGGGDRHFRGGGPGGRFDGDAAGVAGGVESGAARTATATATTTGAIIIVTATASAGRAFPAFTIPGGD